MDKENKKKLKTFLQLILQYIDDVDYVGINEYFRNNCRHYIELGIVFPDTLNSFFKEKFSSLEKLLNHKLVPNDKLIESHASGDAKEIEARTSKRQFVLTWVQPGLAGLMDGSVSTLL